MSDDVSHAIARLRAEAEGRRHLDLPMTAKPSDVLAVLEELDRRPAATPAPAPAARKPRTPKPKPAETSPAPETSADPAAEPGGQAETQPASEETAA